MLLADRGPSGAGTAAGSPRGTGRRLRGSPAAAGTAFNLTVAGLHTYHVGRGETLVHNQCLTVLRGYQARRIPLGGGAMQQIDKQAMNHILRRHHPKYWDGTTATKQSFFPEDMTIKEIGDAATGVALKNREALKRIGNGRGQVRAVVDGREYVLGVSGGKIRAVLSRELMPVEIRTVLGNPKTGVHADRGRRALRGRPGVRRGVDVRDRRRRPVPHRRGLGRRELAVALRREGLAGRRGDRLRRDDVPRPAAQVQRRAPGRVGTDPPLADRDRDQPDGGGERLGVLRGARRRRPALLRAPGAARPRCGRHRPGADRRRCERWRAPSAGP